MNQSLATATRELNACDHSGIHHRSRLQLVHQHHAWEWQKRKHQCFVCMIKENTLKI